MRTIRAGSVLAGLFLAAPLVAAPASVSLVIDSQLDAPGQHGMRELESALALKGLRIEKTSSMRAARGTQLIVAGLSSGSAAIRELAGEGGIALPSSPESLLVHKGRWGGKSVLLLCGSDNTGLMYAALDVADQVRLSVGAADPLAAIAEASEKAAHKERSLSKIIMNRAEAERYLYSEEYWTAYLNMMARNRYNTFVFTFGYGSAGYFDPPYPFLFDVPEFPGIRVTAITAVEQSRNLEMLNRIIRMAHDRGISFTLAIWTHIFRARQPKPGLPYGLTDENLLPYTKIALKKLLAACPGIDALQFRVHVESSLNLPQQRPFWKEVFQTIADARPGIRVDMRVKGFSDDLIDMLLAMPLKVRLVTKHWGEEMGLPYHPTEDDLANKYERRHSYADLLEYPRRYEMMYTLWTHGTTKILLWGDPEYARRFTDSCGLWGGTGYDLYEPLAFKMGYKMGLHQGPSFDLLPKDYQFYRWEFERYWHFYQVFGRLGYNPDTPARVWHAEFENRFGKPAAPHVEAAYAIGSRVLPRIVAYATKDLSAGFTWPEKQRWEDLPDYIHVQPADTAQILGIEEAARFWLEGKESAKIWPEQNSRWFARISDQLQNEIGEVEKSASAGNNELRSTLVDMKVLAGLASYHSHRLRAGMSYALFEYSGDLNALKHAIQRERQAIASWEDIVKVTDGVYPDNILMGRGPRLAGSWKDELTALRKGLAQLEKQRDSWQPKYHEIAARLDFGEGPAAAGYLPVTSKRRYVLGKTAYGWHDASLLPAAKMPGKYEALRDFVAGPQPDGYADSSFGIDLPNGEYELTFTMMDGTEHTREHGPMWIVAQGIASTGRFRVPAGEMVTKKIRATVVDGRLNFVVQSTSDGDWILSSLVVERVEPVIGHVPVRRIAGVSDVPIRATLSGPDAIESVRLVYGSESAGYKGTPMRAAGRLIYEATIPAADAVSGLTYFIEAVDGVGRRSTMPRNGSDHPIRLAITSDDTPPVVAHEKVLRWPAGKPLTIAATVTDPSGVKSVHVRYRGVNQHQDFRSLRMLRCGPGNEYRAEIPGSDIDARWDFMYYIEAVDRYGNGAIYPDLDRETPYVVVQLDR